MATTSSVKSYKTADGKVVYVAKTATGSVSGTSQEFSSSSTKSGSTATEEQKAQVQQLSQQQIITPPQQASQPEGMKVTQAQLFAASEATKVTSGQALAKALETGVGIQSRDYVAEANNQYIQRKAREMGIDTAGKTRTQIVSEMNSRGGSSNVSGSGNEFRYTPTPIVAASDFKSPTMIQYNEDESGNITNQQQVTTYKRGEVISSGIPGGVQYQTTPKSYSQTQAPTEDSFSNFQLATGQSVFAFAPSSTTMSVERQTSQPVTRIPSASSKPSLKSPISILRKNAYQEIGKYANILYPNAAPYITAAPVVVGGLALGGAATYGIVTGITALGGAGLISTTIGSVSASFIVPKIVNEYFEYNSASDIRTNLQNEEYLSLRSETRELNIERVSDESFLAGLGSQFYSPSTPQKVREAALAKGLSEETADLYYRTARLQEKSGFVGFVPTIIGIGAFSNVYGSQAIAKTSESLIGAVKTLSVTNVVKAVSRISYKPLLQAGAQEGFASYVAQTTAFDTKFDIIDAVKYTAGGAGTSLVAGVPTIAGQIIRSAERSISEVGVREGTKRFAASKVTQGVEYVLNIFDIAEKPGDIAGQKLVRYLEPSVTILPRQAEKDTLSISVSQTKNVLNARAEKINIIPERFQFNQPTTNQPSLRPELRNPLFSGVRIRTPDISSIFSFGGNNVNTPATSYQTSFANSLNLIEQPVTNYGNNIQTTYTYTKTDVLINPRVEPKTQSRVDTFSDTFVNVNTRVPQDTIVNTIVDVPVNPRVNIPVEPRVNVPVNVRVNVPVFEFGIPLPPAIPGGGVGSRGKGFGALPKSGGYKYAPSLTAAFFGIKQKGKVSQQTFTGFERRGIVAQPKRKIKSLFTA